MKEVVREEILELLTKTSNLLKAGEEKNLAELKELSDKAVEVVALYKDLDIISVTVLIYSLYKIGNTLSPKDYKNIINELKFARKHLEQNNFSRYNKSIKFLFDLIRRSNAKIKEHLQDVMQAARIKNSTALLQKGLSIGQAAGLMGLSNWDLQQYAGKTTALEPSQKEEFPAKKRLLLALKIFGA